MKYNVDEYIGKKFGHITVKGSDGESRKWVLQCDCGTVFTGDPYRIISGHKKSCGCMKGIKTDTNGVLPDSKGIVAKKICEKCGAEMYNLYCGKHYCDDCRKKQKSEYGKRYRESKKLEKEIEKVQEIPKKMSLNEILASASKEHLSYGAYVAKYGL